MVSTADPALAGMLRCARWLLSAALLALVTATPATAAQVAGPGDRVLPAVNISSSDLEFMLQTARMCNGRTAAAHIVMARLVDHGTRKFALQMTLEDQDLAQRLAALAEQRDIALPAGPTRKLADIAIALRGLPAGQVDEAFLRRVGVQAQGDAAALLAREAADPQAWPPLRALAQAALPVVLRRIEVAKQLHSAREDGARILDPAALIPTPG